MKKLGQHFLKNKAVLDVIIGSLELEKNDRVIEVGPGHGELTIPLLENAGKIGASIISIEKDHSLIAALEAIQEKEGKERFEIIEGDALNILPDVVDKITAKNKRSGSYKIVGNIPYYITGKLLRVISELEHRPEMTAIMIQKEVAERICAAPPDMNRLAASVQFWADATIIAHVPRKDFSPVPDVDSAVILLKTKNIPKKTITGSKTVSAEEYYEAIRGIFAQPRKNLINNIFAMGEKTVSKAEIAEGLTKIGIDPEGRPQDLSIEEITAIALGKLWG